MSNEELAAKAARMAGRVMAARLYAASPDCRASRALIAQMTRDGAFDRKDQRVD